MTKFRRNLRDERGMTLVMVGCGFLAFMSATMLAVDVGQMMVARTQSQNAADAGALAGAVALVFDDFNNRSASGPAVQNAIAAGTSTQNKVLNGQTSVIPADVTFPAIDKIRVRVERSTARGNPVRMFIGPMVGINTANVGAIATAEVIPANSVTCVKPFMIPDKWEEKNQLPYNPNTSTFEMYDNHGNPLAVQDRYVPACMTCAPGETSGYTGYSPVTNKGDLLIIRAGTGNNIEPSMYFSWKMPGDDIGGDFYRDNIRGCNQTKVKHGDPMIQEPGSMSGPTLQGITDLIAKDPNATWNTTCKCVKNSAFGVSPRVAPIPLYDPAKYALAKKNGRTAEFEVANWLGFFIDRISGGSVYGYITPITGTLDKNAAPGSPDAFAKVIVLVE
jgi:Flp pilus assembly protein TadG